MRPSLSRLTVIDLGTLAAAATAGLDANCTSGTGRRCARADFARNRGGPELLEAGAAEPGLAERSARLTGVGRPLPFSRRPMRRCQAAARRAPNYSPLRFLDSSLCLCYPLARVAVLERNVLEVKFYQIIGFLCIFVDDIIFWYILSANNLQKLFIYLFIHTSALHINNN